MTDYQTLLYLIKNFQTSDDHAKELLQKILTDKNIIHNILCLIFFCKNTNILNFSKELYDLHKDNLLRNLYIIGELKKISKKCNEFNIENPVLLKGASYLFKLYNADYGYRILSDIDLLALNQHHKTELIKILKTIGYGFGSKYQETLTNGIIKIDIHDELLNSNRIEWRKSLFSNITINKHILSKCYENQYFNFLTDDIDFIYCLFHSAIHHGFNNIKWSVDAYLFIEMNLVKPDSIFKTIESLNLINEFRFILTCFNIDFKLSEDWIKIFNLPYKNKIVSKLKSAKTNKIKYSQYIFNFLLMKKKERLKYIVFLIFPSKKILKLKYSENDNILNLYLKHLIEIIKSAVRTIISKR